MSKKCPEGKEYNPTTKRCRKKKEISCSEKDIYDPINNQCIPLTSIKKLFTKQHACDQPGIKQAGYTCYIHAALHSLLLSDSIREYVLARFLQLSTRRRTRIYKLVVEQKSPSQNMCPRLNGDYIYEYFLKFHLYIQPITYTKRLHGHYLAQKIKFENYNPELGGDPSKFFQHIVATECFSTRHYIYTKTKHLTVPANMDKIKFIFLDTPDAATIAHGFKFEGKDFWLNTSIITLKLEGIKYTHTVTGYICNDTPYIYDSNMYESIKVDWTIPENVIKELQKHYTPKLIGVAYNPAVYAIK